MNVNKIMAGAIAVLLVSFMVSAGRMIHYSRHADELTKALNNARLEIDKLSTRPSVRVINDYYYQTAAAAVDDKDYSVDTHVFETVEYELLVDRLNARVEELERNLAERDRMLAARVTVRQSGANEEAAGRPQRRSPLDDLRESDPERYHEIIERREQMRERAEHAFSRKAFFLLNQDLSDLNEEELEEHSRMIKLLHDIWEIAGRQGEDLPRDERTQSWRAIRENARELEPLLLNARDREFNAMARELGYTEEEAASFVNYLNEVIETTSIMGGIMPMRGGRRGFSMSISSEASSSGQE